jgi:hypothetical protein
MIAGVLKGVPASFGDDIRSQLKTYPGEIRQYVPPPPQRSKTKTFARTASRVTKTTRERATSTHSLGSKRDSLTQSFETSLSQDTSQATTPGSIHADFQSNGSLAGHSANASNSITGPSEGKDDDPVLPSNPVITSAEVVDPLGLLDADSNVDPFDIDEYLDFTQISGEELRAEQSCQPNV